MDTDNTELKNEIRTITLPDNWQETWTNSSATIMMGKISLDSVEGTDEILARLAKLEKMVNELYYKRG